MSDIDYRKFSNRVCNLREAGFIGIGFVIAAVAIGAILLGIYFGTKCPEGQLPCQDGYTCKPTGAWCDGNFDCPAGDDEWRCHPTEFYIAFLTNTKFTEEQNVLQTQNDTYLNIVRQKLERTTFFMNRNTTVEVSRFRSINATNGHNIQYNKTDSPDGYLGVDMSVSVLPIGSICDKKTPGINAQNISDILETPPGNNGEAPIIFYDAGEGVTTGVAVVLQGMDSCRRKKVYCTIPCDTVYQFSTKGCPTYPCTCIAKKDFIPCSVE